MKLEKFTFPSSDGKNKVFGARWIPDGEVKAIVQLCHGMAEHIMRYHVFAEFLAENGILVTGNDHLGHGKTAADPDDQGYFAEKDGNELLIADMHKLCALTKKHYGETPYFLFGHSMGSFLTRQYLCMHGEELDGVIICGTGYQAAATLMFGKAMCRTLALFRGWRYRSGLLQNMTSGAYNAQFKPARTPSDWLSADEKNVDEYLADPLCGFNFTLNGYYNMFVGLHKIIQKSYLSRMPKEMPVLFIAGDQDPVGANGKGVKKVVELFQKEGMQDVSCTLYPNCRHEILNESEKQIIFEDVLRWLNGIILSE